MCPAFTRMAGIKSLRYHPSVHECTDRRELPSTPPWGPLVFSGRKGENSWHLGCLGFLCHGRPTGDEGKDHEQSSYRYDDLCPRVRLSGCGHGSGCPGGMSAWELVLR